MSNRGNKNVTEIGLAEKKNCVQLKNIFTLKMFQQQQKVIGHTRYET